MPEFDFTLIIADKIDFSDDEANALYEAGCDDGTLAGNGSIAYILFTRDADSLVGAIQSAMADVKKAGMKVARVEIDAEVMEGVDP